MGHIQIRNVPDDLHRKLKARAADAGMSLSDYLLKEVERTASYPTRDEWLRRVRALPKVELKVRPADIIRAERDRR